MLLQVHECETTLAQGALLSFKMTAHFPVSGFWSWKRPVGNLGALNQLCDSDFRKIFKSKATNALGMDFPRFWIFVMHLRCHKSIA